MQIKPLLTALVVLPLILGASEVRAQLSGAGSTGTSSNASSETAARPGPTTARMTRGNGGDSSSTSRRRHHRRHHMRHHKKMHHMRHHKKMTHSSKSDTMKPAGATPAPQ